MLVVFSRSKKTKKKSQVQEEEDSQSLSKLKSLELKIRTPGQSLETFADYLKDLHTPDELSRLQAALSSMHSV